MTRRQVPALDEVIDAVRRSRRYQSVSPSVVARLAAEEIPKAQNVADAEKRTKRRLHQIFGAYTTPLSIPTLTNRLAEVLQCGDPDELLAFCRGMLARHASAQERLPVLEAFYTQVFAITGTPSRLMDIACGLNPFALPWMGLKPTCEYLACDIDSQLIGLIDTFLTGLQVPHRAEVLDILDVTATAEADVALLLKAVPCLEQQRAGSGLAALDAITAPFVVVSYPTRSLGGQEKGMRRTYRAQFVAMLGQRPWTFEELELPGELVFVVRKRPERT